MTNKYFDGKLNKDLVEEEIDKEMIKLGKTAAFGREIGEQVAVFIQNTWRVGHQQQFLGFEFFG